MERNTKLNIKEWAEDDRPREKMMKKGANALSDAELLAILIGSGNTEETAVELSKRILSSCKNNLNSFGKITIHDLCKFKGIGSAKAITIEAALELGKRRKQADVKERIKIQSSNDIYDIFHPIMCDLPNEELWILLLNQGNKIIDKIRISSGGLTGTVVDSRTILREALMQRATSIALCHNHPSGNSNPSRADDNITFQVKGAAETMEIRMIDHLVVCDGTYYSYADNNRL